LIGVASPTTDGADSLASASSPVIDSISALLEGSDIFVCNVDTGSGFVNFSSATTDGEDVLASLVDTGLADSGMVHHMGGMFGLGFLNA
jgi:hypothetical protein